MRVDIMVELEPVGFADIPWRPEKSALSPAAQTAILVNLVTEDDNVLEPLPGHRRLFDLGGLDAPAEEKRGELAAHMANLQDAVVREQEILARLAAHAENQEAQRCPSPSS